jgi:hypothetical protein
VTPPGIDPGTFRLVAWCLNHYATPTTTTTTTTTSSNNNNINNATTVTTTATGTAAVFAD